MKAEALFPLETMRIFLRYDPATGGLYWKPRKDLWFRSTRSYKIWNTKYAGKQAGSIGTLGYRQLSILNFRFYEHRIVYLFETGLWPENEIDHRDGNRANNLWENLHETTRLQNSMNVARSSANTSGATGVYQRKDTGKWQAQIKVRGRKRSLGCCLLYTSDAADE